MDELLKIVSNQKTVRVKRLARIYTSLKRQLTSKDTRITALEIMYNESHARYQRAAHKAEKRLSKALEYDELKQRFHKLEMNYNKLLKESRGRR